MESSKVQRPTVGRIVHYTVASGTFAAIVSEVFGEDLPMGASLHVFVRPTEDNGYNCVGRYDSVPYSETPKHGHWSWPPRV